MLDDFADLPLVRYPMLPYQRRALSLRDNFTAYDAFYVALAESKAAGHTAVIETWQ
jgi:predicted nucleic acid-binding protein